MVTVGGFFVSVGNRKMKELNIVNGKMNTLQFAELTGTAHYNVLIKARKLLTDLGIESLEFSSVYKSPTGDKPMLELDKDLSLTLAGQYEPKIAYHVAKSFNAAPQPQLPQTFAQALRVAADIQEALELEQTQHNATRTQLEYTSTQLDQSKEYFSIKRVAANNGVSWKVHSWHKLKASGAPIVKIFDANYGEVNAYHHTAWKLAYPDAIIPR